MAKLLMTGAVLTGGFAYGYTTENGGRRDRDLYRATVDLSAAPYQPVYVPILRWFGYRYLPLTTLDKVQYTSEIPWESTSVPSGVLFAPIFQDEAIEKKIAALSETPDTKQVDATFEAGRSIFGTLAPIDAYSNFELRTTDKRLWG